MNTLVRFIPSLMLFVALVPGLPYGYFQFLRLVVTGFSCLFAFVAFEEKKKVWMWLFIGVTVLFNPLIPIHLSRDTWLPIDTIIGIVFIVFIIHHRKKGRSREEG